MLQKTNTDAVYCHQRAEESRRLGRRAMMAAERAHYQAMEDRWMKLARSYELVDRIGNYQQYVAAMRSRRGKRD